MAGNKLSAKGILAAGPGRYGDGGGLWLTVTAAGSRKWTFRYATGGKQKEFGLGSVRDVSLAKARDKAAAARKRLSDGLEPFPKAEAEEAPKAAPTFGEEADALIASMEPGWRNPKHRAQWRTTLGMEPYDQTKIRIDRKAHAEHVKALTALRAKPVDLIDTADVLAVLKPLWLAAPDTASRLRGRIEAVLAAATAKGHRTGPNPAQWRNHLDRLLPKRTKLSRGHHGAMPFADVPAFMERLRTLDTAGARAFEFLILTAARTGEALGARWGEIDLAGKVWTIPAARMKAAREHRVPLSGRALAILAEMALLYDGKPEPTDAIFPGRRLGQPASNMVLEMILRRFNLKSEGVTAHGFRSAFRDWCGEATNFPREVAEAALAHTIGNAVEAAYRRGDALEKRRVLMETWAGYCEPKAGNVVAFAAPGKA